MERKLVILIDSTGTVVRALHQYLFRTRHTLKARGYLYFPVRDSFLSLGDADKKPGRPETRAPAPVPPLHGLTEEIQKSGWHTCVVSTDIPPGDGWIVAIRQAIPDDIPVEVVYYALRQDLLAEALYARWVASPVIRYGGILDDALVDRLAPLLDHAAVLRPWAETFGNENIILRCDEEGQIDGSVVQDFCQLIGLVQDGSTQCPPETDMQGISPYQTEFLRLCNLRLPDKPEVHHFLLGQFFRSRFWSRGAGRHYLSPEKRLEILQRFGDTNRDTARRYLNRGNGRLFNESLPLPDEPWAPFPGLTAEELVPILMELIYEQQGTWERPKQPVQLVFWKMNALLKDVNRSVMSGDKGTILHQSGAASADSGTGTNGIPHAPPRHHLPCRVEELVPRMAEQVYLRNLRFRKKQPLGTMLLIINHMLAHAARMVPPRKQKRLQHMLAGE